MRCQVIVDLEKWKRCGKPAYGYHYIGWKKVWMCEEHFHRFLAEKKGR